MKPSNNITIKMNNMIFVVLIGLLLTLAACSPGGLQGEETQSSPTAEIPPTEGPEPTATMAGGGVDEVDELEKRTDLEPCPSEESVYQLYANHHFWTNSGFGDWTWEANGSIVLYMDESGVVTNDPSQTMEGKQYGEFVQEDTACSFEAPAEIFTSVSGTCSNGVLTLDIWEDWHMGTYNWVCDEDSAQFDLPPMGSAKHENVKFALTKSGYYETSIPWGGGNGFESWTLMANIEPVPIVTP